MITLRLYLENIAGDWFGWIEGYPGALSQGATRSDVENYASPAFSDYVNWLKRHGEPIPDELIQTTSADFVPKIVGEVPEIAPSLWQAHGYFPSDALPVPPHRLEQYFSLLRHARTDLTDAAHAIPPHEWDTAPLGGRSIRALMLSLAEAETLMLSHMGAEPTYRSDPDPLRTLSRTRTVFEQCIRDLHEKAHDRAVDGENRKWSLHKILRQTLCYERHICQKISTRSNPTAYLRAVARSAEAVVRQRDHPVRAENLSAQPEEEALARTKHTHASAYYY